MNLKKKKHEVLGCLNEELNIFAAKAGDTTLIVRQARPEDVGKVKEALLRTSIRTFGRYITIHDKRRRNWAEWTCNQPLFKKGQLGRPHLLMEIDDEIVGFANITFKKASEFKLHQVPEPDATAAYVALCVIDEHQGRGIGSLFAHLSEYIDKYFGATWGVATTYVLGGTVNIRRKGGWNEVDILPNAPGGTQLLLRKRLSGETT